MLLRFADWIVYGVLRMDSEGRFAGALHFLIYDSIKIFLSLALMIFFIGVIRTYLPEERIRNWIGRKGLAGYTAAALFGAVTPFCSCSSIPIFFGFLKAGVPLGVVFSFLITSPLINEYLVVLMAGFFGWKITALYVFCGIVLGVGIGFFVGRLRLEACLEPDFISYSASTKGVKYGSFSARLKTGMDEAVSTLRKIWIWVFLGVAAGAVIHNYVPQESVEKIMGMTGVFSVPLAVVLGIPLYGSCAAIVPIAVALFQKGIPLGTALSFMMAVSALSLPEAIMLRRAMNLKLIGAFFGLAALAMMLTGYILNLLQPFLV